MIVRIVTARVPSTMTNAVHARIREAWLPALRSQPGVAYVKLARRIDGDGERLVLITEWRTVADLYRWAGDDLDAQHLAEGDASLIEEWKIEHYESLDLLPDEPWTRASAGVQGPEPPAALT